MAEGNAPDPEDEAAEHRANTALVVDVALREGSLLARRAINHKLSGGSFKDIKGASLPRASFTKRVAAAALARLAARSVPGTLLVAGGLVVKAVFDRRKARGNVAEDTGE